ncbi:MAG: GlsB/YeaQ/YmgE family stress response membrane protein [Acidobacteria bacterium]|nr:GlsB/YeaQ/YmgE family stress response membrane protein [Acidobacteriota bacterium]
MLDNLLNLLALVLVAFVCGALGARLAGSSRRGCITSIVLGFIGALIGTLLSQKLGIKDFIYLKDIPVLWSIAGAAIFIAVLNFISGGRRR